MLRNSEVVYIGGFEMPDGNAAAHRVSANAKALQDLGYNVIFIGVTKVHKHPTKTNLSSGPESYAQPYPAGVFEWFKYITCFTYYKKIIKKHPNTKAIICYNLPAISLFLLTKFAKRSNIKIIADCTEWYEVSSKSFSIRNLIKKIDTFLRMEKFHLNLDSIIVISSFLNNYYRDKGVKTIIIPPLTDSEDPKWSSADNDYLSEAIEVSYIGSPFALGSKNSKDRLDYLVRFFSDFDDNVKLNIVGITKEDFLCLYPDLYENASSNSVVFHGRKTHLDALNILKKSNFSIFLRDKTLTTQAGFPTKFAEAITAGVPILTNKSSNIDDYLVEGENGFWLDNSSYESLSHSLKTALSTDKQILIDMKRETKSSKLFDYRNYLTEFDSIIK